MAGLAAATAASAAVPKPIAMMGSTLVPHSDTTAKPVAFYNPSPMMGSVSVPRWASVSFSASSRRAANCDQLDQNVQQTTSSKIDSCPPSIPAQKVQSAQLAKFPQAASTSSMATTSSQIDSACPSPASSAGRPVRSSVGSVTSVFSQDSDLSVLQADTPAKVIDSLQSPSPARVLMPTLLQASHGQEKLISKSSSASASAYICGREAATKAFNVFDRIDGKHHRSISKLDLLKAMQQSPEIRNFVLPGLEEDEPSEERIFDEAVALFAKIANGNRRVDKNEFARFFEGRARSEAGTSGPVSAFSRSNEISDRCRQIFALIDHDGDGLLSKLDLLHAMQQQPNVASIMFPGMAPEQVTRSSSIFDAVDELFETVASGKKRIDCSDLMKHFSAEKSALVKSPELAHARIDVPRHACRALLIAPGFGQKLNPRQCQLVEQSGFQVEWVHLPNPESPGFALSQHLGTLKSAIDRFRPHLVAGASKGHQYITALWNTGLWRGPTLLLNAHPDLKMLPKNVPIVIAHGSNDDLYPRPRDELEQLILTGSPNMCFLYTTGDSGMVGGQYARRGDGHNMESILHQECLPRLMDATLSSVPEMYMMWSWREKFHQQRIQAEQWLGYSPEALRRLWVSTQQRGLDSQKSYEVPYGCEEFQKVSAVFLTPPKEQAFYRGAFDRTWQQTEVVSIERVENGSQEGGAQKYYDSLQKSVEEQGLRFEPGLHTRWAFHGTSAVDAIVNSPITGFQPLMSGTRMGSVWGSGTYFARDAKYVVDSNLCQNAPDGTCKMLMCLLMTGMSCLGSPAHDGVLPFRQKPYRYNSSVDSLSTPEIFVMQHAASAHAAYVVTFRPPSSK